MFSVSGFITCTFLSYQETLHYYSYSIYIYSEKLLLKLSRLGHVEYTWSDNKELNNSVRTTYKDSVLFGQIIHLEKDITKIRNVVNSQFVFFRTVSL